MTFDRKPTPCQILNGLTNQEQKSYAIFTIHIGYQSSLGGVLISILRVNRIAVATSALLLVAPIYALPAGAATSGTASTQSVTINGVSIPIDSSIFGASNNLTPYSSTIANSKSATVASSALTSTLTATPASQTYIGAGQYNTLTGTHLSYDTCTSYFSPGIISVTFVNSFAYHQSGLTNGSFSTIKAITPFFYWWLGGISITGVSLPPGVTFGGTGRAEEAPGLLSNTSQDNISQAAGVKIGAALFWAEYIDSYAYYNVGGTNYTGDC